MSHYKDQVHDREIPVCPQCHQRASETHTRYGIRNQCDACELWSWDRYPLVDADTHAARKAAHEAFDSLWKDGILSRTQAYKQVSKALEIDSRDCHMKLMDKVLASQVPAAVEKIKQDAKGVGLFESSMAKALTEALKRSKK